MTTGAHDCRNCTCCTEETRKVGGSPAKAKIRCRIDISHWRYANTAQGCLLFREREQEATT